mmetsp:Transcript_128090/g.358586  ORF Transcript_128090/g.358586 Transcript_128090/m.358586 type:complete len:131 (-) Transcript_128090:108-500(-)
MQQRPEVVALQTPGLQPATSGGGPFLWSPSLASEERDRRTEAMLGGSRTMAWRSPQQHQTQPALKVVVAVRDRCMSTVQRGAISGVSLGPPAISPRSAVTRSFSARADIAPAQQTQAAVRLAPYQTAPSG